MKIVATDGYTVNPGDLSWKTIEAFGEFTVYERTPNDAIAERCRNADIILINKTVFTKQTLSSLERAKLISVLAAGYNTIDVAAAKQKGITVCNAPAYGTSTVAQHTIALLLEITNHVGLNSNSVANGEWIDAKDWCYSKATIIELAGKTLGIIGFGNIGQQVAKIAHSLGMKVLYYSTSQKETIVAEYSTLENIFKRSDFISLHCPLKPDNFRMVNQEMLKLMKRTAYVINTARGQLINEQDLSDALNNHLIAGAALDVLSSEPPDASNPLLKAKNCLITPHNAWMSREARQRILDITVNNIRSFLSHHPINVVNA